MLSEWQAPLHTENTGRQEWQSWALSYVAPKLCQAAVYSSSLPASPRARRGHPSHQLSVTGCLESALEE